MDGGLRANATVDNEANVFLRTVEGEIRLNIGVCLSSASCSLKFFKLFRTILGMIFDILEGVSRNSVELLVNDFSHPLDVG